MISELNESKLSLVVTDTERGRNPTDDSQKAEY